MDGYVRICAIADDKKELYLVHWLLSILFSKEYLECDVQHILRLAGLHKVKLKLW